MLVGFYRFNVKQMEQVWSPTQSSDMKRAQRSKPATTSKYFIAIRFSNNHTDHSSILSKFVVVRSKHDPSAEQEPEVED